VKLGGRIMPAGSVCLRLRLAAFENRCDGLAAGLAPLEKSFNRTRDTRRQRMLLYAIANAEHFRTESPAEESG
jgi:hypothetical protein